MKKFLSMLMAIVMTFSLSSVAMAADFQDIADCPQAEAIEVLETLGVVGGFTDKIYGPNETITREQLCVMLVRALNEDSAIYFDGTNDYKDVADDAWALKYIDTARRTGLMSGYGNGYFGPTDKLTYTQAARMILNVLGYGKLEWPTAVNANAFTLGLFENINVYDTNAPISRAHAAQMIYNAFDNELVKEYEGFHFGTGKYFLADVLSLKETTALGENGEMFVAYEEIDGDKTYITDLQVSETQRIYMNAEGTKYSFEDTNKSKKNDIDLKSVDIYINGVKYTGRLKALSFNKENTWNKPTVNAMFVDGNIAALYVSDVAPKYIHLGMFNGDFSAMKNELISVFDTKLGKNIYNTMDDHSVIEYFEDTKAYTILDEDDCFVDGTIVSIKYKGNQIITVDAESQTPLKVSAKVIDNGRGDTHIEQFLITSELKIDTVFGKDDRVQFMLNSNNEVIWYNKIN